MALTFSKNEMKEFLKSAHPGAYGFLFTPVVYAWIVCPAAANTYYYGLANVPDGSFLHWANEDYWQLPKGLTRTSLDVLTANYNGVQTEVLFNDTEGTGISFIGWKITFSIAV